jgi:hypothetical protein
MITVISLSVVQDVRKQLEGLDVTELFIPNILLIAIHFSISR